MDSFSYISFYEFILRRSPYGQSDSGSKQGVEELVSQMGFFHNDATGGSHSYISTVREQGSLVPG